MKMFKIYHVKNFLALYPPTSISEVPFDLYTSLVIQGLLGWLSGKESTCQCGRLRRYGLDWVIFKYLLTLISTIVS